MSLTRYSYVFYLSDVYKGMVDLLDRAKSLLKSFKHIVLLAELPNEVPGKKKKVCHCIQYIIKKGIITQFTLDTKQHLSSNNRLKLFRYTIF